MLRDAPGQPAPDAFVAQILEANSAWLRPQAKSLSYRFRMEQTTGDGVWQATIGFQAPDTVVVKTSPETRFERRWQDK